MATSRHQSTRPQCLPDRQARTTLPAHDALQRMDSIGLSQARPDASSRELADHTPFPPTSVKNILLVEGKKKNLNIFVSLMFIHVRPKSTSRPGTLAPSTTPRRVLLDTGADFNLISHGAHLELGLSKQKSRERVRSIGGLTELNNTVIVQWHFRTQGATARQPPRTHHGMFFVLPAESDAKFDCILGRPWIEENWAEFNAIVELNRQNATA